MWTDRLRSEVWYVIHDGFTCCGEFEVVMEEYEEFGMIFVVVYGNDGFHNSSKVGGLDDVAWWKPRKLQIGDCGCFRVEKRRRC